MTPEMAFSHPFISKAVNELKCLRTGTQANTGNDQKQGMQRISTQPDNQANNHQTGQNDKIAETKQSNNGSRKVSDGAA